MRLRRGAGPRHRLGSSFEPGTARGIPRAIDVDRDACAAAPGGRRAAEPTGPGVSAAPGRLDRGAASHDGPC
jgi:hypothetical protein